MQQKKQHTEADPQMTQDLAENNLDPQLQIN